MLKRSVEDNSKSKQKLANAEADLTQSEKAHEDLKVRTEQEKRVLRTVTFSSDSTQVFAGSDDGSIYSWETNAGKPCDIIATKSGATKVITTVGRNILVAS